MSLHIGHHFFGAGNVGDDLILAGFLRSVPAQWLGAITCCVPHNRAALAVQFPEIEWLPYTPEARRAAIARAQVWLGLGGSPFQVSVSRWFVDHLAEELEMCTQAGRRMYFLAVGGQDAQAYRIPEIAAVVRAAGHIWTRDASTAEAIAALAPGRVSEGADLAHIYLADHPPPAPTAGRLTAVLNFDYRGWESAPAVRGLVASLSRWPAATERVWLAQERRALPGAERALYNELPPEVRDGWRSAFAEAPSMAETVAGWPVGQWQLSSRYHATLLAAWAGSSAVIVATNDKLRAAAAETGFPLLEPGAPAPGPEIFASAVPPARAKMAERARLATAAAVQFFAAA